MIHKLSLSLIIFLLLCNCSGSALPTIEMEKMILIGDRDSGITRAKEDKLIDTAIELLTYVVQENDSGVRGMCTDIAYESYVTSSDLSSNKSISGKSLSVFQINRPVVIDNSYLVSLLFSSDELPSKYAHLTLEIWISGDMEVLRFNID